MERIKDEQITITKRVHEFHCDTCGELLCTYNEYITDTCSFSNTNHIDIHEFESEVSFPKQNLYIYKQLCWKCAEKETFVLMDKLKEIGYSSPEL